MGLPAKLDGTETSCPQFSHKLSLQTKLVNWFCGSEESQFNLASNAEFQDAVRGYFCGRCLDYDCKSREATRYSLTEIVTLARNISIDYHRNFVL